ncbi:MAG: bifunctional phosphopantothenoylcysteine decarboxylase/phosphopantothenate--cysteine ligase CoaBC [Chromatiales bacterium]
MNVLAHRRVLLGVTGGIAAYKSAEIVRRLREQDAEVRVVMTRAAREFVGPLTMQALSGNPVRFDLFDPMAEAAMGHIELARWADVILIAPASADFLARLAHGLADDLLSTLCLATSAPMILAPAMNQQMWQAPATQTNINALRQRGVRTLGPGSGAQACGELGPGRMLEPDAILVELAAVFANGRLAGLKVLITAGPTREPIDPVRYISNRSSGRMGYALARACAEAGAAVTLVSGPVHISAPAGIALVSVTTAEEMARAVMTRVEDADVLIATAAVADYRCAGAAAQKIKKSDTELTLTLIPNPDILTQVSQHAPRPFTIGFAADTEQVLARAREKLQRKSLDMIAANDVSRPGLGFESEENALHVLWHGGEAVLARARKDALARQLVTLISERYREKNRPQDP